MTILDVSITDRGIQVVVVTNVKQRWVETRAIVPPKVVAGMGRVWPRFKAMAAQIKKECPELEGFELVQVDQRFHSLAMQLEQQFSFEKVKE